MNELKICDNNPFTTSTAQALISNLSITYSLDPVTDITELTQLAKMYASNPSYGDSNRKLLGFQILQIADCRFSSIKCANNSNGVYTDFHWYYSFDYGNCYQFNVGLDYNNNSVTLKSSKRQGVTYGLQVQLGPLYSNNQYQTTDSTGMIVFIHNSTFLPTTSDAVYIETGSSASIEIKKVFTNNYVYPYSECKDLTSFSSYLYSSTNSLYGAYRQQDCFNLHIQQNIIKNCGCYYTAYPMLTQSSVCLTNDSYDCINEQINDFSDEEASAQCPLECFTVSYDKTISTLEYPTSAYYYNDISDPSTLSYYQSLLGVTNLSYTDYKKAFLSVKIYYPVLIAQNIIETPKTSPIDLLSQIGGSLGMFLGLSAFTIIDVIELVVMIMVALFKQKKD